MKKFLNLALPGVVMLTSLVLPVTTLADNSPLCNPPQGPAGTGVNTALGCLSAGSPVGMITEILNWSVVLGIGISLLMIIFAGFQITTASGDPKRVKAGQELITSAISGLLLIIFSIILLNFIGVKLLGLPGFVNNSSI